MGLRSFLSRGLMTTGGVLRKVGEYGAPVIRKIGQVASNRYLKTGIGLLGASLAPVTGGASLGIAGGLVKGLDIVGKVAGKAEGVASKIGAIGRGLQTAGQTISGKPQTPMPYPAGMGGSSLPMMR